MAFNFKMPSFSDFLTNTGDAAGALGQGMAQGRMADTQGILNQDALRNRIDQTGAGIAAQNAALPGLRANNAVRGDILAGLQDAHLSGGGRDLQLSGGLRPSLLSQGTRNYGQQMNSAATGEGPADVSLLDNPARRAMIAQLAGSYTPYHQQFTQPTALPKAGLGEKILSGLGIGAKIGSLFFGG